ncbi:MAG: hypothetical protein NTV63_02720 [Candidatus Woesearchaeota archaeon]|nr:hypothetical protein [Candidatus Woesearchaeota archaeon]
MKKLGKNALERESIVFFIIGALALIVLLFFMYNASRDAEENAQKQICKQSVLMYSKLMIGGKPLSESIKCPTKYISLPSSKSNSEIEKTIANEMYECWDNFGQGKLELFDTRNEKFCVICSSIKFSGAQKEIYGLGSFLATEKTPLGNETYLEFLGTGIEDYEILKNQAQSLDSEFKIDTSKQYGIMFVYAKKSRMSTIAKIGIGAGIAATAGIGLGLIASGAGLPVGIVIIAKAAAIASVTGSIIGSQAGADDSLWHPAVMFVETEKISEIGCTDIPKTK